MYESFKTSKKFSDKKIQSRNAQDFSESKISQDKDNQMQKLLIKKIKFKSKSLYYTHIGFKNDFSKSSIIKFHNDKLKIINFSKFNNISDNKNNSSKKRLSQPSLSNLKRSNLINPIIPVNESYNQSKYSTFYFNLSGIQDIKRKNNVRPKEQRRSSIIVKKINTNKSSQLNLDAFKKNIDKIKEKYKQKICEENNKHIYPFDKKESLEIMDSIYNKINLLKGSLNMIFPQYVKIQLNYKYAHLKKNQKKNIFENDKYIDKNSLYRMVKPELNIRKYAIKYPIIIPKKIGRNYSYLKIHSSIGRSIPYK